MGLILFYSHQMYKDGDLSNSFMALSNPKPDETTPIEPIIDALLAKSHQPQASQ